MHPAMQDLARRRAEDKKREEERLAKLRGKENPARRPASPYGNSSSYTPATDSCPAPFIPAADVYSPPSSDPSPSADSGGGSFDGGGASGDW